MRDERTIKLLGHTRSTFERSTRRANTNILQR